MNRIMAKPLAVLVGRTNVGKTTLFNRLADKTLNIAHATPGATRDCITKDVDFLGQGVVIADSGGLEHKDSKNPFQSLVKERVLNFIQEKAHLILFVVSGKEGINAEDEEIAKYLHKLGKPVVMVVNKVDHENHRADALGCLRFGFKDPVMVSAAQNLGFNELKERVLQALDLKPKPGQEGPIALTLLKSDDENVENEIIKISVLGKPNSGKSTFVNTLLNEDKVMVSDIPGTTVDAIDTDFFYAGQEICLIDTAGIRKQRSIYEEVEKMAVARSLCALDRSQVAILMISAEEGISEQDQKIAGFIFEKKKACVIVINKWDEEILATGKKEKLLDDIKFHLSFLAYAPVVFCSAKYGHKVFDVLDRALLLAPRFKRQINTSKLNRSLNKALEQHPPPVIMGRRLRMYFAAQIDHSPPTFLISCSKPQAIHFSYKRYLTNFFRDDLGLSEIPLRLIFRSKSNKEPFNREA